LRTVDSIEMISVNAGGDRCEFVVYTMIGLGGIICTSGIGIPLGAVIGGGGLFLAMTGACPTKRYEVGVAGDLQKQNFSGTTF